MLLFYRSVLNPDCHKITMDNHVPMILVLASKYYLDWTEVLNITSVWPIDIILGLHCGSLDCCIAREFKTL